MNDKIRKLAEQAGIKRVDLHYTEEQPPYTIVSYRGSPDNSDPLAKFAELIVKECIRECKQEWYDLNAESVADDDSFRDPRATGIRVGQKAGVLKCISRIKEYFGVEE